MLKDQRGLSLVELMVGIAVGMFIVAAAATLVGTQLSDNRRLMLELQVQQDLRATADIITRDLRRIGSSGVAGNMGSTAGAVWIAASPTTGPDRAFFEIAMPSSSEIQFMVARRLATSGPYGYRLATNPSTGVGRIQTMVPLSMDEWADLTDSDAVNVIHFEMTLISEPGMQLACPKLCADSTKTCWPTLAVRSIAIDIKAQSRTDPTVVREVHSVSKLRNDAVTLYVSSWPSTQSCPS
jgi:Tfp pilus assembly protein PilW